MYQSIILRHINFFTYVIFVKNFEENKILFFPRDVDYFFTILLGINYCEMRIIAKIRKDIKDYIFLFSTFPKYRI